MANTDDGSDISEADVNKLAHSLGDLDDMDADLFGDALNKKNNAGHSTPRRSTPHSKTPKSPTRVQSPTKGDTPTGSAKTSLKRKPVKPLSPSATPSNLLVFSPRSTQPEHKPGTAPGKMTGLGSISENLLPGQKANQRPETAPKVKKKYDFGDFDPDDPLAGILSGSDEISESDRPTFAAKNSAVITASKPKVSDNVVLSEKKPSTHDSPRRQNIMDRPPTRSGNGQADNSATTTTKAAATTAADLDSSSGQTGVKSPTGIFSDSDDLLDGLGLEDKAVTPAKQTEHSLKAKTGDGEEVRPARSVFDSLLGKGSSTASQLLERKEKKEFVLDKKYSTSFDANAGGKDEEDGFQFGNYQPSAATGSRPNSRRSVRFQDDDDIFGLESHTAPGQKSTSVKKAPLDMEWLEMAAKSTSAKVTSSEQKDPSTTSSIDGAPQTIKPPSKQTSDSSNKTVSEVKKDSNGVTDANKMSAVPSVTPSGNGVTDANKTSAVASVTPSSNGVTDANKTSAVASVATSARSWLGLEDSESDGEFFKPKKSPARSAKLPQSPALSSASASPRVFPKKPSKKNTVPSKTSPTNSNNPEVDEANDDWLARAKSRRQQMLAKDEGKGANVFDKNITASENGGGSNGTSVLTDFAALNFEPPKFGGSLRVDMSNDLFSAPQSHPSWAPKWETSKTVTGENVQGGQVQAASQGPQPGPQLDTRLQLPTAMFGQDQPPSKAAALSSQAKLLSAPELDQQQYQPQQNLSQQQHQPEYHLPQQQENLPLYQLHVQRQEKLPFIQLPVAPAGDQIRFSDAMAPGYSQMTSLMKLPDSLPEAQAVIRKLEMEKTYTESLLENTRRRYEEEMLVVETSYKNRLQIIEDSNKKREARLREENEELMQQHLAKVRQLEQERSDLSASHYRRLEDLERQKAEDLEKLKEQHRLTLKTIKREHEEALQQLASAKNQEINMVANANDTSKSLTAVVQQIQNNARDLGELQIKIDSWSRQGLDEREISLRSKDEQLRILQERLNRQAEDNDRERRRLEDLIAHMEAQLRDQTRTLEEERWRLKQDQSRVEAQQRSLEEERRQWLEQQARDRVNIERARENFLEEQNRSVAQISEERHALTEERTKFQIEQKTAREKSHQDTIKRSQAEAEYEALMRTIADEKAYHNNRRQELQKEEERIASERSKLEKEKRQLEQDQDKVAVQAHQIREQSEQIDHLTEIARHSRQEGEQAMEEATQIRAHIERRETELRKQMNELKVTEDYISQERLRLAKEKKEVENLKNSSLCSNCRTPLHANNALPQQNGYYNSLLPHSATLPSAHLNSLAHQLTTNPLDRIAVSIANDRAVRLLKIQAIKDREFLQEESVYLEGLRHTPYHSTASKS